MERRRVSFPIAEGTRVLFAPRLSSLSHSFKPSSCSDRPTDCLLGLGKCRLRRLQPPASLPIATRGARSLASPPPPTSTVVGHIIHLGLGGREGPPRRGMALQWSAPGRVTSFVTRKDGGEGGREGGREGGKKGAFPPAGCSVCPRHPPPSPGRRLDAPSASEPAATGTWDGG